MDKWSKQIEKLEELARKQTKPRLGLEWREAIRAALDRIEALERVVRKEVGENIEQMLEEIAKPVPDIWRIKDHAFVGGIDRYEGKCVVWTDHMLNHCLEPEQAHEKSMLSLPVK